MSNLLVKSLWEMFDIWDQAGIKSAYTRKRCIVLKTKALIAMDRS